MVRDTAVCVCMCMDAKMCMLEDVQCCRVAGSWVAGLLLGVESPVFVLPLVHLCSDVNVYCSLDHLWHVLRVRIQVGITS